MPGTDSDEYGTPTDVAEGLDNIPTGTDLSDLHPDMPILSGDPDKGEETGQETEQKPADSEPQTGKKAEGEDGKLSDELIERASHLALDADTFAGMSPEQVEGLVSRLEQNAGAMDVSPMTMPAHLPRGDTRPAQEREAPKSILDGLDLKETDERLVAALTNANSQIQSLSQQLNAQEQAQQQATDRQSLQTFDTLCANHPEYVSIFGKNSTASLPSHSIFLNRRNTLAREMDLTRGVAPHLTDDQLFVRAVRSGFGPEITKIAVADERKRIQKDLEKRKGAMTTVSTPQDGNQPVSHEQRGVGVVRKFLQKLRG